MNTQIIEWLELIAIEAIRLKSYSAAESICNLLVAQKSGRWSSLPQEEKAFWVKRLLGVLGQREGLATHPQMEGFEPLTHAYQAITHYHKALLS